uniref:E3 ubiquitin-protein ligase TRIM39-like n=1 Tax=Hucho hucho TaxID=62062 RepID=A0A4W5KJ29_9TELE
MASANNPQSEMQLICSICEEVLNQPVTTPCGHNFCMDCIREYWESKFLFQCPQCKEKFPNISELKVNTKLSKMVAEFWNPFLENNTSPQDQCLDHPREVSHDICVGREVKAGNSSFEASYCETPLEPNQRVATLRRQQHVENLEEQERHGRCLEFKTDNNTHNTVPLEVKTRKNKVQLGKAEVQKMIQGRQKKVIEIRNRLQSSRINAEQEVEKSCQIFRALMGSIERSQAELIEVILEKQKETKRLAEGLIKELEEEITDLKLLQSSPSLCTSPPTKDWSEIRVQSVENVGMVRKAVKRAGSQFEDTVKSELKRLCEAELKLIQQWSVDVTLDPDTAHPNLTLSEDVKQLRHPGRRQNYPGNPERFSYIASVLGKEGFSSGRFYYEVQVKGKTLWSLGVARESINRTIHAAKPENGLWTIQLGKGNVYRACTADPTPLSLSEKPQKVGVYVDYEDGEVSFYNAQARSHIYSFTDCSFTEKLYPYFNLGVCGIDKMSAPLIISHVSQSD